MGSIENDEILRPLDTEEVNELLKLYKEKYGKRNFHYLLLYNQCKWNGKLRELRVEDGKWNGLRKYFYTHRNADFKKYGTYISLNYDIILSISFNSWEPGLHELYECLEKTNLIDWNSGPLLTNVCLEFCERIKAIAASKGVEVQRARLSHGLIMPHKDALKLNVPSVPPEYEMHVLEERDADLIHDLWPNKKEGSLEYVRSLICVNKSLGIYRKSDRALVSWVIQNDFSGLGLLQTLPEEQGKGFGKILTAALSKCISEEEKVELSAWIVNENLVSQNLVQKVGFEKSVLNEWIQLKAKSELEKNKIIP